MKKKDTNLSKLTITLYVIAAIVLLYGVYAFASGLSYLSNYYRAYGLTLASSFGETLKFLFNNTALYIVYAVLLYASGRIYEKVRFLVPADDAAVKSEEAAAVKAEDDAEEEMKEANVIEVEGEGIRTSANEVTVEVTPPSPEAEEDEEAEEASEDADGDGEKK